MGNRAAFATQAEIYMPQLGGYDPIGVIRDGRGNPNVWLIAGQRLYLFYDRTRMESSPPMPIAWRRKLSANGPTSGTCSALDRCGAGRIGPRHECRDNQILAAVNEWRAARRHHFAAGRGEDGMARGGVPVVGRRQPRIEVG